MRKREVTFLHRVEYVGWQAIGATLKLVPRRAMIASADAIGWLMYTVLRVRQDVIDEQLKLAFGTTKSAAELRLIGLRSWQNCVLTFFEFLQPQPTGGSGWNQFQDREGYEEHVPPLLAKGNALIITAHMGNWEAMGNLGLQGGFQIAAVAKAMHNPLVNEAIVRTRREGGMDVLLTNEGLKNIVQAARGGEWIAFLGDQDARRSGIFVEFFGRPASTAEGPAHFAHRLNLPLLPAFCVRNRDAARSLRLIVRPPIVPDPAALRDADVLRMTTAHVAALEAVIREHPEDYFWLHRRWKTKPKLPKALQPRHP